MSEARPVETHAAATPPPPDPGAMEQPVEAGTSAIPGAGTERIPGAGLVYRVMTAGQPGAVAILQLGGDAAGLEDLLSRLAQDQVPTDSTVPPRPAGGEANRLANGDGSSEAAEPHGGGAAPQRWPVGRMRLISLAGIDEGLAGRLPEGVAQLMPHGGPRVVQRLTHWLEMQGVRPAPNPAGAKSREDSPHTQKPATTNARWLYPEAASAVEADLLHALAGAQSPAAVDALTKQPARWRRWLDQGGDPSAIDRSGPAYLIRPAAVVVVGRPNAGKSTLLNQLTGRASSVVTDRPGTTRDWVGARVELVARGTDPLRDAVAVRWIDTPGLRASDDAIEQGAIRLAQDVIQNADILIALRRSDGEWPEATALPRTPDLWVINLLDADGPGAAEASESRRAADGLCSGVTEDRPLRINARGGAGVDALAEAVLNGLRLGHDSETDTVAAGLDKSGGVAGGGGERGGGRPWAFSPWLRAWSDDVDRGPGALAAYLGVADQS